MKKIIIYLFAILAILLIIIQFVPVDMPQNSEDLSSDLLLTENVPEDAKKIMVRSCYDCHSNQTSFPWYAKVAPASWLLKKDIEDGRDELNFSEWAGLDKRKKIKILSEMVEEVEAGKMPLKIYTFIHRDATLTEAEIATLSAWTNQLSDNILGTE